MPRLLYTTHACRSLSERPPYYSLFSKARSTLAFVQIACLQISDFQDGELSFYLVPCAVIRLAIVLFPLNTGAERMTSVFLRAGVAGGRLIVGPVDVFRNQEIFNSRVIIVYSKIPQSTRPQEKWPLQYSQKMPPLVCMPIPFNTSFRKTYETWSNWTVLASI